MFKPIEGLLIFGPFAIMWFAEVAIATVALFAPVTAFLSWRLSNSKKIALYSAVYSLLMLMPGIWLVLKLRGVSPPKRLVVLVYSFLYVAWLSTVLWMLIVGLFFTIGTDVLHEIDTTNRVWLIVVTSVASGAVWLLSVKRASNLREAAGDDLLNFARIEPFVSFIVCNVAASTAFEVFAKRRTSEESIAPFVAMAVVVIGWMLVRIPFFVRDEIRSRTRKPKLREAA